MPLPNGLQSKIGGLLNSPQGLVLIKYGITNDLIPPCVVSPYNQKLRRAQPRLSLFNLIFSWIFRDGRSRGTMISTDVLKLAPDKPARDGQPKRYMSYCGGAESKLDDNCRLSRVSAQAGGSSFFKIFDVQFRA